MSGAGNGADEGDRCSEVEDGRVDVYERGMAGGGVSEGHPSIVTSLAAALWRKTDVERGTRTATCLRSNRGRTAQSDPQGGCTAPRRTPSFSRRRSPGIVDEHPPIGRTHHRAR